MRLDEKEMLAICLDVLRETLEDHGQAEGLCFIGLMPGAEFLADYVECGGMAWVQLIDSYDTIAFPSPATGENNCAVGQPALTLTVGILRKAPNIEVINNEPIPPSPEESTDATLAQMDDLKIINDFLRRLGGREDLRTVASIYVPTGPAGGSLGGTRNFAITSED